MKNTLFGTDGIRGNVGSEHINPEAFYDMGVTFACTQPDIGEVVIGHDSRDSGYSLAQAAAAGVTAALSTPILVDVASTPAIAHLSSRYGGGISVTASHNGAKDNGFKPFVWGEKLTDGAISTFEENYHELRKRSLQRKLSLNAESDPSMLDLYTQQLQKRFPEGSLSGKSLILDCANGACSEIAPGFFREYLGAKVIEFASDVKDQINDRVGAANLDGLRQQIAALDGSINRDFLGGFSFDGDGDRVMGMTAKGDVINGNHWLSMLADGEEGVVGTLYTNNALRRYLAIRGVEFHECANGDSSVTKRLRQLGLSRGGEFTGHLVDLSHLSSGDGIFMAAQMATQLAVDDQTLQDVFNELPMWPEHMDQIQITPEATRRLRPEIIQEIIKQQLGARLAEDVDVVVRPSGTEPLLRIWAQARDKQVAFQTTEKIKRAFYYFDEQAT